MKFEEQEMGILGIFWKHYRTYLQALKKWIIGNLPCFTDNLSY